MFILIGISGKIPTGLTIPVGTCICYKRLNICNINASFLINYTPDEGRRIQQQEYRETKRRLICKPFQKIPINIQLSFASECLFQTVLVFDTKEVWLKTTN